jgi:hypothetical protein
LGYFSPVGIAMLYLLAILATNCPWCKWRQWEPAPFLWWLCETLLKIARGGNEFMTMAALGVFEEIFGGLADEVGGGKLEVVLEAISELRMGSEHWFECSAVIRTLLTLFPTWLYKVMHNRWPREVRRRSSGFAASLCLKLGST